MHNAAWRAGTTLALSRLNSGTETPASGLSLQTDVGAIHTHGWDLSSPVPEIIDPVFAKTSQNARFLLSENERFGLVFVKTGSINSGTGESNEPAAILSLFMCKYM